jgi:hypothetical protein
MNLKEVKLIFKRILGRRKHVTLQSLSVSLRQMRTFACFDDIGNKGARITAKKG